MPDKKEFIRKDLTNKFNEILIKRISNETKNIIPVLLDNITNDIYNNIKLSKEIEDKKIKRKKQRCVI
jgi:hypothetical protein